MNLKPKNILIEGAPGVGKTTLIKTLIEQLKHLQPAGFYTAEIREKGERKGFELVSLDGRKEILSHVDIKSPIRVGKYRVDTKTFEGFLESIGFFLPATGLVIIDEIGKMECLSDKFQKILKKILDSEKPVIATVSLKGGGPIADVKKRPDIKLFEITRSNRGILLPEILELAAGEKSNS
jgi:nucleoside-triphosphatase